MQDDETSDDLFSELTEKITRADTPAGIVVYREFFDQQGRLVRRDVEHLISVILKAQSETKLKSGD